MRSMQERLTKMETVSRKIYDAYMDRLGSLPAKERMHFLRRAYRISGDPVLGAQMTDSVQRLTVPRIKRRARILESVVYDGAAYPEVSFKPTANVRNAQRNALFESRPELQFFRRYLIDLFHAHSAGLHNTTLSGEWSSLLGTLHFVDFDAIFVDLEVISKISSYAVNSVIFLDRLEVDMGLHRRFLGYLKGAYFEDDLTLAVDLDTKGFSSLIYNLTHVVIAYSGFYQNWVHQSPWIADFFAKSVESIIHRCNHDIIAEVALSLKLMRLDSVHDDAYFRIIDHLLDTYSFDENISGDNLRRREHTNAVILLLFSQVDNWHAGPHATPTGAP